MQKTIMVRRSAPIIIKSIYNYIEKHRQQALSPTKIARETGLNYNACKEYLDLIVMLQEKEGLGTFKTPNGELYIIGGMSSLPKKEQDRVLIEGFGAEASGADRLYIGLLDRGITSQEKAVRLEEIGIVKKGLAYGHLKKLGGRVYLTKTGQYIAGGARDLFGVKQAEDK